MENLKEQWTSEHDVQSLQSDAGKLFVHKGRHWKHYESLTLSNRKLISSSLR